MAKYTIKPGHPDGGIGTHFYEAELGVHWESKAVYTGAEGYQFILTGKNFRYDGQEITSGTVTGASFRDQNGGTWYTLTDFRLDASKLPDISAFYWAHDATAVILGGKDKVIGSSGNDFLDGYRGKDVINGKAGNDEIDGNQGNDRMTGGTGNDTFYFRSTSGHDTITDFKQHGDADVLHLFSEDYTTQNTRDGLLISIGDDFSVLLEGFKLRDLEPGDIV